MGAERAPAPRRDRHPHLRRARRALRWRRRDDGREEAARATASAPKAKLPVYSRSPRLRIAIAAGVATVILGIALGSLYVRPPANRGATESQSAAAAPSWQSPRLPSQPADSLERQPSTRAMADGRGKGIVALAVLPFTSYGEAGEPSR